MSGWKEHHYARAAEFVRLLEAALGAAARPVPAAAPKPPSRPAAIPTPPAPPVAAPASPPPPPAAVSPAPPASPAPAAKATAASVFKNIPWKK